MRRALIIGLDEYPDYALHGCVNDAQRLTDVLSRVDFQIKLTDIS